MTGPWWGLAGLVVGLAGLVLVAAWRPRLVPLVALAAAAVLALGACAPRPALEPGDYLRYGHTLPSSNIPPPAYTYTPNGAGGWGAVPW